MDRSVLVRVYVLQLQASELKESLDERKREAEQRRSAQAARLLVKQADAVFVPDDLSEISEVPTEDATDAWSISPRPKRKPEEDGTLPN